MTAVSLTCKHGPVEEHPLIEPCRKYKNCINKNLSNKCILFLVFYSTFPLPLVAFTGLALPKLPNHLHLLRHLLLHLRYGERDLQGRQSTFHLPLYLGELRLRLLLRRRHRQPGKLI